LKRNYITYGPLVSPLGATIDESWKSLIQGNSKFEKSTPFSNSQWPLGTIDSLNENNRFEQLFRIVLEELNSNEENYFNSEKSIFIISSTKGDLVNNTADPFALIRQILKEEYGLKNEPIIISNACISGVMAINLANDLLLDSDYDNAVVIGIDVLSEFVVNGFQSLFALSDEVSKPFDSNRKGINLGEAAAAVLISNHPFKNKFQVEILGGSSSNDANHISGPSRTGEGLVRSITKTLSHANVVAEEIDFISAHGTATLYNDEMESIAFDRMNLNDCAINSFKGYTGHTLGAAGVLETMMSMKSMENNLLIKSAGFSELGVSKNIKVITENETAEINTVLKTASGFGGGNATLLLKKIQN
jgi:3-oxoacyl-[acyl-carrier-protein] synthase-1